MKEQVNGTTAQVFRPARRLPVFALKKVTGEEIPWWISAGGQESVLFSLQEKNTETYLAFRIPSRTSEAVMDLMTALHGEYGDRIFETITVDNGSGFADFAQVE